jgi:hypothetical protein
MLGESKVPFGVVDCCCGECCVEYGLPARSCEKGWWAKTSAPRLLREAGVFLDEGDSVTELDRLRSEYKLVSRGDRGDVLVAAALAAARCGAMMSDGDAMSHCTLLLLLSEPVDSRRALYLREGISASAGFDRALALSDERCEFRLVGVTVVLDADDEVWLVRGRWSEARGEEGA